MSEQHLMCLADFLIHIFILTFEVKGGNIHL